MALIGKDPYQKIMERKLFWIQVFVLPFFIAIIINIIIRIIFN